MEIPCHFMSQMDGALVQIHIEFRDNSMSFIQVLFVFHAGTLHGFWTSSSHGNSMAFAKKMMGFPSDLVSSLVKLSSKGHEKIPVTFFTGLFKLIIGNGYKIRHKAHFNFIFNRGQIKNTS